MIFVHGFLGSSQDYFALCREIASHGHIVFNIDMIDGTCRYTEKKDGSPILFDFSKDPINKREDRHVAFDQRV